MDDSDQKSEGLKKRLANLRPSVKGEVRNPKGRPPKDVSLTSLLKVEVEKLCPADKLGRTWRECLVIATMSLALKGKDVALKEVWQRLDGKVTQAIDLNATIRTIEDDIRAVEAAMRRESDEEAETIH